MKKYRYASLFSVCLLASFCLGTDVLIIKDEANNHMTVEHKISCNGSRSACLGALMGVCCAFADRYSPAPWILHWILESSVRDSFFNRHIAVRAQNNHVVIFEDADARNASEYAMCTLSSQDNEGKTIAWLSSWVAYLAWMSFLSERS